MRYSNITECSFISRPNRFIANVLINGKPEVAHVKNTGRCKELLIPGTRCWCEVCGNPSRKTKYDLIAVEKGKQIINMDSQAPNKAVLEWLRNGGMGFHPEIIKPEAFYGQSRIDFMLQHNGNTTFIEVKGVTLENNGIVSFPDAPTERGVKHLHELMHIKAEGMDACVLFVIQMQGIYHLEPNAEHDPAFAAALKEAASNGVKLLAYDCIVTPDSMILNQRVNILL